MPFVILTLLMVSFLKLGGLHQSSRMLADGGQSLPSKEGATARYLRGGQLWV